MKKTLIPGNRYTEMAVYSDTTTEAIKDYVEKLVRNQQANMRSNPRYVNEVMRLGRILTARRKAELGL